MAMGLSLGMSEDQRPERNIDWIPLLIVIGAVYLITSAIAYGMVSYGGYYGSGDYRIEFQINIVLGFLASTSFIIAIASVIYSRIEQAKKLLVVGMLLVIVMFAIRTEVYLRSTM